MLKHRKMSLWKQSPLKFTLEYLYLSFQQMHFLRVTTRLLQKLNCPPTVGSGGYILGTVRDQPPKCYILMSHWTIFILHWVIVFVLLNEHFPYYFLSCPSHLILIIDGSWIMEDPSTGASKGSSIFHIRWCCKQLCETKLIIASRQMWNSLTPQQFRLFSRNQMRLFGPLFWDLSFHQSYGVTFKPSNFRCRHWVI